MNPTDQVKHTEELSFGDQESDDDDDDRRELISHYANDKYLSKWELADEDEAEHEKSEFTLHVHVPSNTELDSQDRETDYGKTESVHLVATLDCDDLSLVSYNSIRDCTPSATPKTDSTSVQCHLEQLPQSTVEDLKLWQGYGGNIYFDAVKCQSMRINSAKSGHARKDDIAKRWKSKSCIPSKRRDEHQAHSTCIPSTPREVPTTSIHNLGSLRMRSCKERKCRLTNCRHKDTTRHTPGKICKGFSEKLMTETFKTFQEGRGHSIAKEPLAVSGGQVRDSVLDPIDKVQQFNTQYGFPALLSDSSFFSHQGGKKGSSVHVVSGDGDTFTKLPFLGKYEAKKRKSKLESENKDEASKPLSEPSPVFIIPFGSFDDPVDSESDLKRKVDKKQKASTGNSGDGIDTSVGRKKEISNQSEGLESSPTLAIENHNVEDTSCGEGTGGTVKRPVNTGVVGQETSFKRGIPDFQLKTDISNLSLSNFLRAVPTRLSKEQNRLTSPQSSVVPKMSYTKRSRAPPTFYMVNNSLHHAYCSGLNQRVNGSQVYGGYFPTTGRKDSKLFYAEISTCAERNSLSSDPSTQVSSIRTKSSSSNRTSSTSPRLPKHAHLKASYVSRNSFTRQSVERSPRVNKTMSSTGKNLLPVTGHQISGLSGVHDR